MQDLLPSRKLLRGQIFSLTALAWPRGGHRTQALENYLLPRLVKSRLEIKEWKKCTKSIDFCRSSSCYKKLLLVSTSAPQNGLDPTSFSIFSLVLSLISFCFLAFFRCN